MYVEMCQKIHVFGHVFFFSCGPVVLRRGTTLHGPLCPVQWLQIYPCTPLLTQILLMILGIN